MAIAFVDIQTHKRSLGHSVAAALAYRAGLALRDVRTGELHDYRPRESREEIADVGIVSSRSTPLAADWQTLADEMESREKHPRARILRDVKVGIPHELDLDQKKRLARRIAEALSEYGDTVVPYALHAPSARGDERNWHCHHVLPTRSLTADGQAFGHKLRDLDNKYRSPDEIARIRNTIGDLINEELREAGIDEEVRMGRRVDEEAEPEIPGAVVQLARRLTEKRLGHSVGRAGARELVDRAVANGDVERLQSRGTIRRRGAARSGDRPRYRRRSRTWRQRRAEEKQKEEQITAAHVTTPVARVEPEPEAVPARPRRRRRRRKQTSTAQRPPALTGAGSELEALLIELGEVEPPAPATASAPGAEPERVPPILTEPEAAPKAPRARRRRTRRRQEERRDEWARATTEHPPARAPRPPRKRRRRVPRETATPVPNPTTIPVRNLPGLEQLAPGSAGTENDATHGEGRVVGAAPERRGEEPSPQRIPRTRRQSPRPPMPTGADMRGEPHGVEPAAAKQLRETIDRGAEDYGADLIREHAGEPVEPSLAGVPPRGRQGRAARRAMHRHVRPFFVQKRAQVAGAIRKWRRHFQTNRPSIIASIFDSVFFAVAPLAWLRAQGRAAMRRSSSPQARPRPRATRSNAPGTSRPATPVRRTNEAQPRAELATARPDSPERKTPIREPAAQHPERTPVRGAMHSKQDREALIEAAAAERLRASVWDEIEKMGKDTIRSHAGDASAYPALPDCPPLSPSGRAAEAALARHLRPFLVEDRDRRRPGMSAREERRHHAAVERGIKGWSKHLQRHRDRVAGDVVEAVWPHFRDEAMQRHRVARQGAEQRSQPRPAPVQDLVREHGFDRAPTHENGVQGPRRGRGRERD